MRPLLTPREMSAADERTIAAGTPAGVLMDRAGRGVARVAIEMAGGRYGRRALVLCGTGNNGGDGFVAARRLADQGLHVRCFVVGDVGSITGAAAHHLDGMVSAGVRPEPFDPGSVVADVVVDALFGTGFRGTAEGEAAKAIEAINELAAPTVSVDIPSGVAGATGAVFGPTVQADVTVAMGAEKVGTACAPGAGCAGEVRVRDIGIDVPRVQTHAVEASDVAGALTSRTTSAHKGSAGSVAIVAGSEDMTGAALLTCRGADRAGAGYVRLGSVGGVKAAAGARLPEVLTSVIADRGYGSEAWEAFSAATDRSGAVAIGPGMGAGPGTRDLVLAAAAGSKAPLVLDADALNSLGARADALADARSAVVLTPHPGELGRLLGLSTGEVQADRLGVARRAAKRFGQVVLLKGYRSVIAAPAGDAVIDPAGGPSLATAGTGDVLTGVIAAFLAAGLPPFEAAWAAAYVHGTAGTIAAEGRGVDGVVAWDVAEALPEAMRRVRTRPHNLGS